VTPKKDAFALDSALGRQRDLFFFPKEDEDNAPLIDEKAHGRKVSPDNDPGIIGALARLKKRLDRFDENAPGSRKIAVVYLAGHGAVDPSTKTFFFRQWESDGSNDTSKHLSISDLLAPFKRNLPASCLVLV